VAPARAIANLPAYLVDELLRVFHMLRTSGALCSGQGASQLDEEFAGMAKRTSRVTWEVTSVLTGALVGFYGSAWGRYWFIRWSEHITDTSYRFDIMYYAIAGAFIGGPVGALFASTLFRRVRGPGGCRD
jgi:hypothetical protein